MLGVLYVCRPSKQRSNLNGKNLLSFEQKCGTYLNWTLLPRKHGVSSYIVIRVIYKYRNREIGKIDVKC